MKEQLDLNLMPRSWGGARANAGRKKSGTRHDPEHRARPPHIGRLPLHVVLRVYEDVGRLRRRHVYKGTRDALKTIMARVDFRVVHLSIQHNHLHFLIEAADNAALESGMRGLAIALAKRINKSLSRRGKVFQYRYHTTQLTSPTQTRNAIAYVLNNWRRHREDERGFDERTMMLDPYSSAFAFAGWADASQIVSGEGLLEGEEPLPVSAPRTWLLGKGWELSRRSIRTSDTPGPIH